MNTLFLQYSGTPSQLKGPGGAQIWMDSNDGSGSGLDADKVDGYHAQEGSTGSSLAARDSAGDISTRLFRSEYSTTDTSPNYVMTTHDAGGTSDNYIRPCTFNQFRTSASIYSKSEVDSLLGSSASWTTITSGQLGNADMLLSGFSSSKTLKLTIYGTWLSGTQLPLLQLNGVSTASYYGFYASSAGGAPTTVSSQTSARLIDVSGHMTSTGFFTMEILLGVYSYGGGVDYPYAYAKVWDKSSGYGTWSIFNGALASTISSIGIFGSASALFKIYTRYKLEESTSAF